MKKINFFPQKPVHIFLCLLVVVTGSVFAQSETRVTLSSSVDQKKIPLNRTVSWIVRIEWQDALSLIEIEEFEEPVLSNFDIVGSAASNRRLAHADGQTAIKEMTYTLAPKTLGMGYIESAALTYKDKATGESHHLMTQRVGVKVIDAVPEPGEIHIHRLPILLGLVFVVGILSVILLRRQARKNEEEDTDQRIPEEQILEELKNDIDLKNPQRTESLTQLMKLFRKYLAHKYEIPALEATTSQLIGHLKDSGIESQLADKCEVLFNKAEVLKFSGQEASQAELDEAYTIVETMIEAKLKEILADKTSK